MHEIYENSQGALNATDQFYSEQEGFQYTEELASGWIEKNVKIPKKGRVLDLCCGDGIWSRGFQLLNPDLEIFGVDISKGGIDKAKKLLNTTDAFFKVCNAEETIPFPDDYFDLIFARGPGLYNQHSMESEACVEVLNMWHKKLKPSGRFYSIFASTPRLMGTYTPMDQCKLPYNRAPRKTTAVDFSGGKYHHSIETYHAPFLASKKITIMDYFFKNNLHILITRK